MKEVAIGIDIGGTNTVFGIVNREGVILNEGSIRTNEYDLIDSYINNLSSEIQKLIDATDANYKLKGIGVGAPNGNYYSGTIEQAPNLPWKGTVPFVELLEKKFDTEIVLTNDANAAAMGEMIYGGAKGMSDFIMITLGTGLGSGVVSKGQLIYGHDGFAGELGHITVDHNGRQCGCGRKGCLETYASATGIKRTVFELLATQSFDSKLRNINFNEISSKIIYEAALQGDKIALAAFDYTAKILGIKLADAVAFVSPEAIFLFGGLANAKDLILKPVKQYMEQHVLNIYKNKVKVLPSALMGTNIAVLGASALIWK